MPVYAQLSANEVVVAPGSEEHLRLLVRNLGQTTESFVIVPLGLGSAWTIVDPPNVTLFAGEEQSVVIALRPPRSSHVTAGATGLTLRVVPHGAPDETATVEATVRVLAFDERRISLLQPVLRARTTATYDLVLQNLGNDQATARLHLVDETGRLRGRCEPASIGVEPGQNATAQVRVHARRRRWRSGTASLPFIVEATQEGRGTATASGTLLQAPLLTAQLTSRLLGIGAVAAVVVGGWLLVARPALDDAAERAVADRLGEVSATTVPLDPNAPVVPSTTVPGDSPSVTPTAAPSRGQAVSFRLAPTVGLGEAATEEYRVPDSLQLDVTDVIVQNPAGDQGTVALTRNGDVLLTWNLINVIGDDVKQFVTPLSAAPGDVIGVTVVCEAAGNPTLGACTASVSLSGRLVSP